MAQNAWQYVVIEVIGIQRVKPGACQSCNDMAMSSL